MTDPRPIKAITAKAITASKEILKIKKTIFSVLIFLILCTGLFAQSENSVIEIWGEEMPYPSDRADAPRPNLTLFPVESESPRPAVIICPGGGYHSLAMKREGYATARELNKIGISAYVLRYRLGTEGYKHPAMIADLQQSIALLRKNSREWNIDPRKIGVLGYSAGGHLSATAAVHSDWNYSTLASEDGELYNVRPNFAILCYPVITMESNLTHLGSKFYLLGSEPSEKLVFQLSNENHVSKETPPVFLVHAEDDFVVNIANSRIFYQKLQLNYVPSEFYIYKRAGHNFGVNRREWFDRCIIWLVEIGVIETPSTP